MSVTFLLLEDYKNTCYWKVRENKANIERMGAYFCSKCKRLPRPFGPPKEIDGLYAIRVEIAAVAALLRNDMPSVFLLHAS
ncbi:MAG: hypothetical protein ACYSWO_06960 [Planctomycetota bacterium]